MTSDHFFSFGNGNYGPNFKDPFEVRFGPAHKK